MILKIETLAKRVQNITVNWFLNIAFLFFQRQTANMIDPTEDTMWVAPNQNTF